MFRRLAAAIGALALVLLVAAPALAGGWAEVVADARDAEPPPVEGQPIEVGFTVLQHGVTPAGWETPTVTFTEISTGQTFHVTATARGADGHFVAMATMPRAGFWTWSVTLEVLGTDPVSYSLAVRTPDGVAPVLDPVTAVDAIDRARRDATSEANGAIFPQLELINTELERQLLTTAALEVEVDRIAAERDALATRLDAAEAALADGGNGVPILGVVMFAVLAGASAGFAMAWLAGRSQPQGLDVSASAGSPSTPSVSPRGSMPG